MNKIILEGIEISSSDRIVYPKEELTKLDVIKYYQTIAPLMLPYLEKRPLSVIRCHKDINSDCFFKKHPNVKSPHIKTFTQNGEEYFYITSAKGLILEAQNGTIEFHTRGSRYPSLDKPDYMVFDLDPDENLNIDTLREGVVYLKKVLDELKLNSYLKTSGGKGYHVIVPFSKSVSWNKFSLFSKQVALLLESKHPKLFTTNIRKNNRHGKIFIDYLRNDNGSTCVAPYSLRARDNAPISFPISWKNLEKILPNQITINNFEKYEKDTWKNFNLEKAIIK